MKTPTCHPERPYYAKGKCGNCYKRDSFNASPTQRAAHNARARARRKGRPPKPTPETFPLDVLLRFAAGKGNDPLTPEELEYRTDGIVPLGVNRARLTDLEADHLAVALGCLPGEIWPDKWEQFDGPHLEAPVFSNGVYIAFGPCQCFMCNTRNTA